MADEKHGSFSVGDVKGTGIAVGHGASSHVSIGSEQREELKQLIEELRQQISVAQLPQGAKNVLLREAPALEEAAAAQDPKPAVVSTLQKINDQLEGLEASAEKVSGIVQTTAKIAGSVGVAIGAVAPYLARLL